MVKRHPLDKLFSLKKGDDFEKGKWAKEPLQEKKCQDIQRHKNVNITEHEQAAMNSKDCRKDHWH